MPVWSDGEIPPQDQAAPASGEPRPVGGETITTARSCAWCATPAPDTATRCGGCGAALAQREAIGDLVVPGLTAVDPALKDLDGRPLHLGGPSPTQGAASGLFAAAAAGGPVGLAILGGVGALAATEYFGAGTGQGTAVENLGEPSGAVLQAIERLERGEALPSTSDATAPPGLDAAPGPAGAQSMRPDPGKEEAIDGGS